MIELEDLVKMKEMMDSFFKYKIGDLVVPKSLGEYFDDPVGHCTRTVDKERWYSFTYPSLVRYQIVERLLQQCHGGIQKHYQIRLIGESGVMDRQLLSITEDELMQAPPFHFKGMSLDRLQEWIDNERKRPA